MKTADFDFKLANALIAQRPVSPRDSARLLEVPTSAEEGFRDLTVGALPDRFNAGDLLVVNDTRVLPARLTGRKRDLEVQMTLGTPIAPDRWRAFAKPARKVKRRDLFEFGPGFSARVVDQGDGGEIELEFDRSDVHLMAALERFGTMPVPPYIKRDGGRDDRDFTDYQTIFATHVGAVAAPTAGLHFTEALLGALDARGVEKCAVTLHTGPGTYLPVRTDTVTGHQLSPERGEITEETARAINAARARGGRVVAVGSTSLRLLETAAADDGTVSAFAGETDIFITPGFEFRVVDVLLTNFHLPRSTLFMLVCAFAGTERMKAAYEHAKRAEYRFYSYGDCCLLYRGSGA